MVDSLYCLDSSVGDKPGFEGISDTISGTFFTPGYLPALLPQVLT